MTAVPPSEAEAATLARFEAGQAAEEALRERVAQVLHDREITAGFVTCWTGWPDCERAPKFRSLADAAIATVRAPQRSVSAEQGAAGIPMTPERDETVTGL